MLFVGAWIRDGKELIRFLNSYLVASSQASNVRLGVGFQLRHEDSASFVHAAGHVKIQHFVAIGARQNDVTTARPRRPGDAQLTQL